MTDQTQAPRAVTGSDQLPDFAPLMLTGLSYPEGLKQMKLTGCALRRPRWCAPVLIWDGERVWFDDEDEQSHWWAEAGEDLQARDWMMVERPERLEE